MFFQFRLCPEFCLLIYARYTSEDAALGIYKQMLSVHPSFCYRSRNSEVINSTLESRYNPDSNLTTVLRIMGNFTIN